jgi:Ca-activated chloride channel homolog
MLKRYLSLSMFSLLIASLALFAFGCSTTTSSSNPASPPSGTTSVTVGSGGSTTLTANTKTGACSIVLVDQNQNPITSTNNLNINNIKIEVWSSTSTTSQTATVGTLTYNGGSSGSAISYAMTLDRSGSMSYDSNASLEAAALAFINNSGASDQGAVINFDSYVHVDQGLTTNKALLKYAATSESSSGGSTALYDSMGTAVATAAAGSNTRKAVIAMTDGGENNSTTYTSTTSVINFANTNKVPVYCVGLGIYQGGSDELALQAIASGTGGLYYYAPSASDISALYSKISSALSSSWTIDFASPVTFTTGTTYYVKVTITYSGGITSSTTFTVTL